MKTRRKTKMNNVTMSYEDLCRDLGFIPKVRFVEVTNRHTVTYSCGKPEEVRALARACRERGYVAARSLAC
jgi:hypothetical protein